MGGNALREAMWRRLTQAYVNGAAALKVLDRHEEAIAACEEGLKLLDRHFSKHKADVVHVLDLLAELCLVLGQVDKAEQHIARALQIKDGFLEPGHPGIAVSLNLRAQAYVQQGNLESAKKTFVHSLAIHVARAEGGVDGKLPV